MAGGKGIGGLGWSGVYLGWMFGYLIVCTRMQLVRKARGLPRFARTDRPGWHDLRLL
jgi:hypothetical protein